MILNRILPLRKSDGGQDFLIFLGDYIDRHVDSHKVIDKLIKLKKKYKNRVVCIRGNHEVMFLDGIQTVNNSFKYRLWMKNGGELTLKGYVERAGETLDNPYTLPRFRIPSFIPTSHLDFLQTQLVDYFIHEKYIFVHAGYEPEKPSHKQEKELLWWGNGLYQRYKTETPFWDKTIIMGHYHSKPFISEKLMMIDSNKELVVLELNSMEMFAARPKKSRLVKLDLL